jgi:hypothetical protein
MWDNGKIVERGGKKVARRGPVPCETQIGCPKGHWKDKPELTPGESMIIDLYQTSKATGGLSLNESERSSDFLLECFAGLSEVDSIVAEETRRREMETLAARLRRNG